MISSSSVTKFALRVDSIGDFVRSLAEEATELEALLALLHEEQRALRERDSERVYSAASAKGESLARLGALHASRGRFLHANGLPRDHAAVQSYLERTSGLPPEAAENWRRLLANAAEARSINRVNGRLIAAQTRFVGGALAALQRAGGDSAFPALRRNVSHLTFYGADGQTRNSPATRSLASA